MNVPAAVGTRPDDDEVYGTTCLPAARVKLIVKADPEIAKLSNPATFSLSIAAQLFVEYLTKQAFNAMRSDGRKGVLQYRDVAAAVSRIDNLEFLTDVIPKTTTYRSYKQKRAKESARNAGRNMSNNTESATATTATMSSEELPLPVGTKPVEREGEMAAANPMMATGLSPPGQKTVRDAMMAAAFRPIATARSRKRPSVDMAEVTPSMNTATPEQPSDAKRQSRSRSRSKSTSMSPVDLKNLVNERDLSPVPSGGGLSRTGSRRGSLMDVLRERERLEEEIQKDGVASTKDRHSDRHGNMDDDVEME